MSLFGQIRYPNRNSQSRDDIRGPLLERRARAKDRGISSAAGQSRASAPLSDRIFDECDPSHIA